VIAALKHKYADADIDELDGVSIDTWNGASTGGGAGGFWFNVRPSNTEPLLRLNMEAVRADLLEEKLAEITPLLGSLTRVLEH